MKYSENFEEQLQLAQSIIQECGCISCNVLSYDGSPGVCGHLRILLSSSKNHYFLMTMGSCDFLETKFSWKSDELEITFNSTIKKIAIRDLPNNLSIDTNHLMIYELVNYNPYASTYSQIMSYKSYNHFLTDLQIFDLNNIIGNSNTELYIKDFYAYDNALMIGIQHDSVIMNKSIILNDVSYLYFKRKEINLMRIRVNEANEMLYISDEVDNNPLIEFRKAQFVNTLEYVDYRESFKEGINWIFSGQNFIKTNPRELVNL
jgi:hypothetical protein